MAGFTSRCGARLVGSRSVGRKADASVRSRLRNGSAAGKLISSSGVIQIGWSLLDLIALIPHDFGEWFGQRREDNEAVSFSITQSAESHLRAAGTRAGLRTDPGRFGERRTARAGIPGGQSRRAGSGPRRRRRDADGIAGDPRLSW